MTTLGTMLGRWDWQTLSAKTIGSSLSMEESSDIRGLIDLKASSIASKTGVERQFARASLLIVIVTTLPSEEYEVNTRGEGGER